MDNYQQLVERIAQSAKTNSADIERRVEAKRAKLSGLVSKEGAAQIVAAELGVNFDKERMKISELVAGMKRANVLGKIVQLNPVRNYSKNGKEGKVASFTLADESSNVRVVLWDVNHIRLIEDGTIKEGSVIEISNAMMRNGELHLGGFSDVKLSGEKIEGAVTGTVFQANTLKDAQSGQHLQTRAFIVQAFDPRYFEVCPECSKKVLDGQCGVHGTIQAQRRAVVSIVLDDGTETIRGALFGERILQLGLTEEDIFSLEHFAEKKQALLGEEFLFSGTVRTNTLYNTTDLAIDSVNPINTEQLVKELESKT